MGYKIAIASTNGESVDQHFGKSRNFLIYELSDDKVVFIEDRELIAVSEDDEHSESGLIRVADVLQDCKAVFVLKIGMKASRYLYSRGIKSFEVKFSLNYIFETLLKNQRNGIIKIL